LIGFFEPLSKEKRGFNMSKKKITLGQKFPETPPPGDMERKQRMHRLQRKLIEQGLYVRPVYLDETMSEYGYLIVSVDDPY
jgi:hypothetical protein